jgi:hypothetical protein
MDLVQSSLSNSANSWSKYWSWTTSYKHYPKDAGAGHPRLHVHCGCTVLYTSTGTVRMYASSRTSSTSFTPNSPTHSATNAGVFRPNLISRSTAHSIPAGYSSQLASPHPQDKKVRAMTFSRLNRQQRPAVSEHVQYVHVQPYKMYRCKYVYVQLISHAQSATIVLVVCDRRWPRRAWFEPCGWRR